MWVEFLEHWNRVSIFFDSHVSHPPDFQLFTDASWGIGYGGFLDGLWLQGRWLPEHTMSQKWGISIEWQELFPIYLACVIWGPTWSGKRIQMWCDNQSVIAIINSKHFKSPRVMDLVCSITLLNLVNNFTISATHIPGLGNAIADPFPIFRWIISASWLPQPLSLPA